MVPEAGEGRPPTEKAMRHGPGSTVGCEVAPREGARFSTASCTRLPGWGFILKIRRSFSRLPSRNWV